jgi:hypothetical protein
MIFRRQHDEKFREVARGAQEALGYFLYNPQRHLFMDTGGLDGEQFVVTKSDLECSAAAGDQLAQYILGSSVFNESIGFGRSLTLDDGVRAALPDLLAAAEPGDRGRNLPSNCEHLLRNGTPECGAGLPEAQHLLARIYLSCGSPVFDRLAGAKFAELAIQGSLSQASSLRVVYDRGRGGIETDCDSLFVFPFTPWFRISDGE